MIFLTGNRLYQEDSPEFMQVNPEPHSTPFPSNTSTGAAASPSAEQGENEETYLKCLDNIPATSKNTQCYGDKLWLHTIECFCVGSNVSPKLRHC